jgi:hypothetical protein
VGDDDGCAAGDWSATRRAITVKYVHRHGKKIAVDTINTNTPAKKRKSFGGQFVKLPDYWIGQLERSTSPGTFKLAHRILKEDFKRQLVGGEIVLSTAATRLSRKVRSRAVKELVGFGLIEIKQNGNQALRVTDIILKEKKRRKNRPLLGLRGYAACP